MLFRSLPAGLSSSKKYTTWKARLKNNLYRSDRLELTYCPSLKLYSAPGESEGDFKVRLKDEAREKRDIAIEKLRSKYASKVGRLKERLRKAGQRVEVEKEQAKTAKMSAAVSWGSSILGAMFGRKIGSATNVRRAGSAVRSTSRAAQQASDIDRAEENVDRLLQDLEELQQELEEKVEVINDELSVDALELEPYEVKPRKSDISIDTCGLLWLPWSINADGITEPAWTGSE